jgi:molybdopterin synthase sulfur carrier subunit
MLNLIVALSGGFPMANEVTVLIPTPLREFTDGESEVSAQGNTINDIIEDLDNNYSGIKERICTEDGELREFLNIYMNDEDIRFMDELETEINEGDEISIIPAIAGGKSRSF